ncbi:hypothetical protein Jab_2c34710 [Janthinobacterium sp. HH01]|nr:hypothetical protein Jab_2c34710 [Janthinobacterium sp. HH01]
MTDASLPPLAMKRPASYRWQYDVAVAATTLSVFDARLTLQVKGSPQARRGGR